jgi:hypothetical protein
MAWAVREDGPLYGYGILIEQSRTVRLWNSIICGGQWYYPLAFSPKQPECDVRAFQDTKSGKLTLRLQGDVGVPSSWEVPILTLDVRLDAPMTEEVATLLRDQLVHLLAERRSPCGVNAAEE